MSDIEEDTLHPQNYKATQTEVYTVKTIVPYSDEPELRTYEIENSDLSDFLATVDLAAHAETVVDITPAVDD